MLRYLEAAGLVVPARTRSGYRAYGVRELNQLQPCAGCAAGSGSTSGTSPSPLDSGANLT